MPTRDWRTLKIPERAEGRTSWGWGVLRYTSTPKVVWKPTQGGGGEEGVGREARGVGSLLVSSWGRAGRSSLGHVLLSFSFSFSFYCSAPAPPYMFVHLPRSADVLPGHA